MKTLHRHDHNQDERCQFDAVKGATRDVPITCAMSNSFGFGGTNAALIMRKI